MLYVVLKGFPELKCLSLLHVSEPEVKVLAF